MLPPSHYFLAGAGGQDITFTLCNLFPTAKTDHGTEEAGHFQELSEICAAMVSKIKTKPEHDYGAGWGGPCPAAAKLRNSVCSHYPATLAFLAQQPHPLPAGYPCRLWSGGRRKWKCSL